MRVSISSAYSLAGRNLVCCVGTPHSFRAMVARHPGAAECQPHDWLSLEETCPGLYGVRVLLQYEYTSGSRVVRPTLLSSPSCTTPSSSRPRPVFSAPSAGPLRHGRTRRVQYSTVQYSTLPRTTVLHQVSVRVRVRGTVPLCVYATTLDPFVSYTSCISNTISTRSSCLVG